MCEVERGDLDKLALGPDALKEHEEVELEEHHGIDGGTASRSIEIIDPATDS